MIRPFDWRAAQADRDRLAALQIERHEPDVASWRLGDS
jgi:hypothetical protein